MSVWRPWPYAATAIVQHEWDTNLLNVWVVFRYPMDQTVKPAHVLWKCEADGVPKAITVSAWQDEWTILLTVPDVLALPGRVTLEYDGPSESLTTTWDKQWEPWGPILSIRVPYLWEDILVVDTVNKRVGINVASPAYTLHVDGTFRVNDLIVFDDTNFNAFLGTDAFKNAGVSTNIGIGYRAGYNNDPGGGGNLGKNSVFIGYLSGYGGTGGGVLNTGFRNVGLGSLTLYLNTTGYQCMAIGTQSLYNNTSGRNNCGVGRAALYGNTTGQSNLGIGTNTGYRNRTGRDNTLLGHNAGYGTLNDSYSNNTFVGSLSGLLIADGSGNIFLGYKSGYNQTILSNRLIIDNRERADAPTEITNAILYGIMAATPADQSLNINAKLKVSGSVSSGTLTVNASADDTNISGVNTVFLDCSANDVVLGAFVGGVNGQHLNIARLCAAANDATLEHNEGTGNQNIFLHKGLDETLTGEYGGWNLVCNGTSWFDTSHAKHV